MNKPIVVFIDDIDRLPPNEVFDTVRLVKAVADFPRVSFVLAYDPLYVSEALKGLGISNGSKIFNGKNSAVEEFTLPVINAKDIETLVYHELGKLPEEALTDYFPDDTSRLADLYQSSIKFLLDTHRDVKRLFNNLRLNEASCRGEVAFSDLFALEVIALKAPDLYEDIKRNMAKYSIEFYRVPSDMDTSIISDTGMSYFESQKKQRNFDIKKFVREDKEEAWRNLIDLIFPLSPSSGYHTEQYLSHGRIAAKDRLIVALHRDIPSHEIPLSAVKNFSGRQFNKQPEELMESIDLHQKNLRDLLMFCC